MPEIFEVFLVRSVTCPALSGAVQTIIIPWSCIVRMIYLHVTDACLKVTIAMFCFCHSKTLSIFMKNIFNTIALYSWKNFFVSKYKEQMCYKKDESLFFYVMKNDQIFPSKVWHLTDKIRSQEKDRRVVQQMTTIDN